MYRFFINSGQIDDGMLRITGEDVNHMKNVLRMKAGEDFEAADENGHISTCRIKEINIREIFAEVLFHEESNAELKNRITLFMGLPKFDKMELIIQKAVELGAAEIVPVITKRTVVKLDDKKSAGKILRWQTIAEAAAKQSKRAFIPEVKGIVSFHEALDLAGNLDLVLIPYECADNMESTKKIIRNIRSGESIGIFVGPEGGFEKSEIEETEKKGASEITLGHRILRTETAAIAVLSILMFALGDGSEV